MVVTVAVMVIMTLTVTDVVTVTVKQVKQGTLTEHVRVMNLSCDSGRRPEARASRLDADYNYCCYCCCEAQKVIACARCDFDLTCNPGS